MIYRLLSEESRGYFYMAKLVNKTKVQESEIQVTSDKKVEYQ